MMRILSVIALVLILGISCQETNEQKIPTWVLNLATENTAFDVGEITEWEEKQRTWYGVDGTGDSASDTATVNTLFVEGTTTKGNRFIAAYPVTDQTLDPVGSSQLNGESCEGHNGCKCCKFRDGGRGCECDLGSEDCCTEVPEGPCMCAHSISAGGY